MKRVSHAMLSALVAVMLTGCGQVDGVTVAADVAHAICRFIGGRSRAELERAAAYRVDDAGVHVVAEPPR